MIKVKQTIIFVFLTIILVQGGCNTHCELVDRMKGVSINGEVEEKYIKEWDKHTEILRVKNYDDIIYLVSDQSGFWNYVQVGDSVNKKADSFLVGVFREGDKRTFELRYQGCGLVSPASQSNKAIQ